MTTSPIGVVIFRRKMLCSNGEVIEYTVAQYKGRGARYVVQINGVDLMWYWDDTFAMREVHKFTGFLRQYRGAVVTT